MSASIDTGLWALSLVYPAIIFAYYVVSSLFAAISAYNAWDGENSKADNDRLSNHKAVIWSLSFFIFLHFAEVGAIITSSIVFDNWPEDDFVIIGHLSCLLVFGVLYGLFLDNETPVWFSHWGAWAQALVFETATASLMTAQAFLVSSPFMVILSAILGYLRCILLGRLLPLPWNSHAPNDRAGSTDEERQSLLPNPDTENSEHHEALYGSTNQLGQPTIREGTFHGADTPEKTSRLLKGGWVPFVRGSKVLFQSMWSTNHRPLRLRLLGVIACLLAANSLNVFIPRQAGIMMDSLSRVNDANVWLAVLSFISLRMLATDFGISFLSARLWNPVRSYIFQKLTDAAFSHIMALSSDFHDSKSSCDVNMALQSATSVAGLVEGVIMEAAPLIIDLILAVTYLSVSLGSYEGFVVIATGTLLFVFTQKLLVTSGQSSRQRIQTVYNQMSTSDAALRGWHTSSVFNQIGFEENQHKIALTTRWLHEQSFTTLWDNSRAIQAAILTGGFSTSACLAAMRIKNGQATPGKLAMLLMYWSQLIGPLKHFSTFAQRFANKIVDAELLLEIMQLPPSVANRKIARPLKLDDGRIQFDKVWFGYKNDKRLIRAFTLDIPAGSTTAFVGSTGAGVSTLLKLVARLYDVTSGAIRIDGQDIRDVELSSLRERIGLVPQNPLLFNDTVMNNIRYAKVTASDKDILQACKYAGLHDTVVEMSQGYQTMIGENGIKLSAGELQKIAIARLWLRKPDIILIDNATSALDTATELRIQDSLAFLCASRTTIITTHKLSTAMNANHIVVIDNGILIEQGTHDQLLSHKGKYADLWGMQIPPGWKHKDTSSNNKNARTIGFEVRRQRNHTTAPTAN